ERRLDVAEAAHVRDETGPLDGEDEIVRRLVAPARVALGPLQAIEGPVDLDGPEPSGRVGQLGPLRQSAGRERAAPAAVGPARDTDAQIARRCGHACETCELHTERTATAPSSPLHARVRPSRSLSLQAVRLARIRRQVFTCTSPDVRSTAAIL